MDIKRRTKNRISKLREMQSPNSIPFVHYNLSWISYFMNQSQEDESNKNEKITKNVVYTENSHYTILRYNKSILNYDLVDTYGLVRSIIFDKNSKMVCFAPPKSMAAEFFIQKYPDLNQSFIQVEEFIEGTMINVFWDETIGLSGAWEIATRNSVGANTSFYQNPNPIQNNKTFREMFLEAMNECKLTFDHLIKDYVYSFVLQHPENRIVVPFQKPNLYLVAIYHCTNTMVLPLDVNYLSQNSRLKDTLVQYPKQYQEKSYGEIIRKYASMNTPYDIMGVVIHNYITGERSKIRNPVYEQVRQLKGNHAKLQYQYLSLRHQGKISEYLMFYPEHKKKFSMFRDDLHLFTKTLYENYVDCFICKNGLEHVNQRKEIKNIHNYPKQYQNHMMTLHQQFLNELREKKLKINYPYVINYVNEMHPSKLMFSMNYHLRKRNVEMEKMNYT